MESILDEKLPVEIRHGITTMIRAGMEDERPRDREELNSLVLLLLLPLMMTMLTIGLSCRSGLDRTPGQLTVKTVKRERRGRKEGEEKRNREGPSWDT